VQHARSPLKRIGVVLAEGEKRSDDKALIADARVFDRDEGPGVPDGKVSLAVEVTLQPREKTLTDAEIEAVAARIVASAEKAQGLSLHAKAARGRISRRAV
jgi:phenylalanyl-tRNA synthetase beta subunit